MNLAEGFQIEQPALFVHWGIREVELSQLFASHPLRHVAGGYCTTSCVSLGGLAHEIGFHFYPRHGGVLTELEFFRRSYPDLSASYSEFQRHLEAVFGPSASRSSGSEGLPSHSWNVAGTSIRHFVFDRFGPEEHVRIQRS